MKRASDFIKTSKRRLRSFNFSQLLLALRCGQPLQAFEQVFRQASRLIIKAVVDVERESGEIFIARWRW